MDLAAGGCNICSYERLDPAAVGLDEAAVGLDEAAVGLDEAAGPLDEDAAAGPLDEAEAEDKNFLPQLVAI